MAENSSDGVTWYLEIPTRHKEVLGAIRHWDNLKVGVDGETTWVKDFNSSQIESVTVKILPFKEVYYSRGPKLFPYGSGLPVKNIPSLLWSPIDRLLQVTLTGFNHNYFGVQEKIDISVVRSNVEREAVALLVAADDLLKYLETAAVARVQNIDWVMMGDKALLKGTPLLPLSGLAYWQQGMSFLPAGYDLDLPVLAEVYDSMLADGVHYIVWDKSSTFTRIPLNAFRQLSIGSFRNTMIR